MTESAEQSALEATGERLVPGVQHGQLVHAEHLARYQLAAEVATSRRVLDAACGEGYGTDLLAAAGARSVVGIDSDERTIAHARERYPAPSFVHGDVRQLPFEDRSFELVVSFETVEHVRDPELVLDEFGRVLTEDGFLLISTPNKDQYLAKSEFHEREFSHEEFVRFLSERFQNVDVLLQQNWLASAVLSSAEAAEASGREAEGTRFGKLTGTEPGRELYTVALCGSGRIPTLRPVVVAASLDEAHTLARRVEAAERTVERLDGELQASMSTADAWHDEYKRSQEMLFRIYDSVWWRLTSPLRRLADRLRGRHE